MSRILIAAVVLFAAPSLFAVELVGTANLVAEDVATVDSGLNPVAPVDVYQVEVSNPNAGDATSLELSLPGTWINNGATTTTFRDDASLPTLATFTFGETFFVLPGGTAGTELAVDTTDDNSLLASNFTLPGTTALIPAGGSTVVAVLTVAADSMLDLSAFSGRAAIGGAFESIAFGGGVDPVIPEPTSAALIGLGLVGFAARRRR